MRVDASVRPQVVAAFLALSSLGSPVGAAGAGLAIAQLGFRPTYGVVAALMTASALLLAAFARRGAGAESAPAPAQA